jgi:hypothetical protein
MVGRHRNLEILYVGHVLNDALAVVGPLVDAIGEMGPVFMPLEHALGRRGSPPPYTQIGNRRSGAESGRPACAV